MNQHEQTVPTETTGVVVTGTAMTITTTDHGTNDNSVNNASNVAGIGSGVTGTNSDQHMQHNNNGAHSTFHRLDIREKIMMEQCKPQIVQLLFQHFPLSTLLPPSTSNSNTSVELLQQQQQATCSFSTPLQQQRIHPLITKLVSALNNYTPSYTHNNILFCQFLVCLFDMVRIPELTIVSECENPKTAENETSSYSLQFAAHLKLLQLRSFIVFIIFKLSQDENNGILHLDYDTSCSNMNIIQYLISRGDISIDVNELSKATTSAFMNELSNFEQMVRFHIGLVSCNSNGTKEHVSILNNNNMNHIRLHSHVNHVLIASFDRLSLKQEIMEEELKMRLYCHVGKYMTFAKCGNMSICNQLKNILVLKPNGNEILVDSCKILTDNNRSIIELHWNSDFFVTPGRQKTDVHFNLQFENSKTDDDVLSVIPSAQMFIDHLRIILPSQTTLLTSVKRNGRDVLKLKEDVKIEQKSLNNSEHEVFVNLFNTLLSKEQQEMQLNTLQAQFETLENCLYLHEHHYYYQIENEDDTVMESSGRKRQKLGSNSRVNNETNSNNNSMDKQLFSNIRDICGFTLLHSAAYRGMDLLCKFLIESAKIPVDVMDHYLYTPFHWTCFSGHVGTANLLLKNGASIVKRNIHLYTGLDLARLQCHNELVQSIESKIHEQASVVLCSMINRISNSSVSTVDENANANKMGRINQRKNSITRGGNRSNSNASSTQAQKIATRQKRTNSVSSKSTGNNIPATVIKATPPTGTVLKEQTMELFIKPSRKKRTYISFFPKELCSSPYKYDILLRIPLHFKNQFSEEHFHFQLLIQNGSVNSSNVHMIENPSAQRVVNTDAVSPASPNTPNIFTSVDHQCAPSASSSDSTWVPVKHAIEVVKYLRTMLPLQFREIEWRIMFKVCSFHFHRKPFKFQVIYRSQRETLNFTQETNALKSQITSESATETTEENIKPTCNALDANSKEGQDGRKVSDKNLLNILSDGTVVFESEPFWVVARKKKDWLQQMEEKN
jgi:hypothetical protein